jgi:hypothetical protein
MGPKAYTKEKIPITEKGNMNFIFSLSEIINPQNAVNKNTGETTFCSDLIFLTE